MKRILWSLLILLTLVVAGCGYSTSVTDPATGTGTGSTITDMSLTPTNTTLIGNGSDYSKLTAKLVGGGAGITVEFSIDYGSLDLTAGAASGATTQSVTTGSTGEAVVYVVAPTGVGEGTVTVSSRGYTKQQKFNYVSLTPAAVTLSAAPTSIAPKGRTTLTATVVDSTNPATANPVAGHEMTFSVTTDSSGSKFEAKATTNAQGKAIVTYTAGDSDGVDTIEAATKNGKRNTVNVTVSSTTVVVNKVDLSPATTILTADGSSSVNLTVTVLGAGNVPAVGKLVTVTTVLGTSKTVDADAAAGLQVKTDANGMAEINYIAGKISGNGKVTVNCDGLEDETLITLNAGVPALLDVSFDLSTFNPAAAKSLVTGGTQSLYARVTDINGNLVTGANVAFSFVGVNNQSGATLSAGSDTTDSAGLANIIYTAGATGSKTDTVTITTAGVAAKTLRLSVTQPVAAFSLTYNDKVTTDPATVSGGETIRIYARAFSNTAKTIPAANANVSIGFPLVDDNKSGASVTPTSASTDEEGYVIFTYTAGAVRTAVSDRFVVSAGSVVISDRIDVAATLQTMDLYYKDLSTPVPAGTDIVTGSGASTVLFVQLFDGNGNPRSGVTVNFAFDIGKNLSGATIVPATFVTDAKGFATATYKAGSASGVTDVLSVSVDALSEEVSFKVDPVVTTILFDKTELIVGDSSSETDSLTFTLKNQLGQPLATNFQIIAGGDANPNVTSGTTAADGTFTIHVYDPSLENRTITVTAGGQSKTIPVYAGATLELTPTSANAPADGTTQLTYTASLRDYNGVVLAGLPITFSGQNKVILSTGKAVTDAGGNATVKVRSSIFTPTDTTKEVNAQAGALTAAADAVFEPGPAKTIALSIPAGGNPLSLGGETTVTAVVTDALGNPVKTGTAVNFSLNGTIGSVTGLAITADATGRVTVPFQAGMKSGNVVVTATSGAASSTINLTIRPSTAGIIELSGVDPATKMINIRGSGLTQSATIYFTVKDGAGNPVADGTVVNFTLPIATITTVAAGGEAIATTTDFAPTALGTTVNGIASVTLRSGMQARTVAVQAKVTVGLSTISTEARVTIVGGQPDSRHISLATQRHNIAGGVTFGLQNDITAFLGDRYSNIPIDGTPISFYSECGTIGDSTGFVLSSVHGQATAHMHTQNPTTPNLAGVKVGGVTVGNVGVCTVLAVLPGQEYYDDFNANGVYDAGVDSCSGDQGEPYIDGNDTGSYELGEFFVDLNNNGSRNGPDGNCSSSTMIWDDISVMMSSFPAPLDVTPSYFNIPIYGSQEFNLNLADLYGNAPVAGTKLTITADGGTLGGTVEYTVPDYVGIGNWYSQDSNSNGVLDAGDRGIDINGDGIPDPGTPIRFWLNADTKADAEAKFVKITIIRTPAPTSSAGTDGVTQNIIISGMINTPPSSLVMNVSSTPSTLSNGTGTANVTATLTDVNGTPMQGHRVTFFTVPAGATNYGSFTFPTGVITNDAGQVTARYTAGQKAGFVDLVASATVGDYVSGSTTVRILSSTATDVTLSLSDNEVTAGTPVTASVLVNDTYDNPVPNQVVTFSIVTNTSGGAYSTLSATTNSFGIASVTYTPGTGTTIATGSDLLRASIGVSSSNATLIFHSPDVSSANMTVNLATSSLVTGGQTTTTVTASVSDISSNPVEGVEVTFSTTRGTISPLKAFTNGAGVATATLDAGTTPGSGVVTASANAGALTDTAPFTLAPGAAARIINVLASPATVAPSANSTISVRVVDVNNNPVADGTFVSFAVTTNNSGGSIPPSGTTVSGNASVVYTAGITPANDIITISTGSVTPVTVGVKVDAGFTSIDVMTISATPLTLRNNGTDFSVVTVKVSKGGVPANGIAISFANPEGNGVLTTTEGAAYLGAITSDTNGEAKVIFTPSALGRGTITASFGAFTKAVVITTIDKVADVVLTVDSPTIVANGSATTRVTATVLDIDGGPLANIVIKLATTRGTLAVSPPYIDADASGQIVETATNSSGQVIATLTSSSLIGTALVTANYDTILKTEPVQFVVGPPNAVTLEGSPTLLPYGGQTSLTVSVVDSQLRPVPNANLYFGFSPSVAGNESGGTYSVNTGVTDEQGRFTLIYTSGIVPGDDELLVETDVAGVDDTLTIEVDPTAATIGNMILAAPTSPSIVANGTTTTQLTATVTDSFGAPMNGVLVSFATTYGTIDTDITPQTKSISTDAAGKATVTLKSTTTVGTAYVTAVTGGFQGQQTVNFIPGNPVWKKADNTTVVSTITPVDSSLPANGTATTAVNVVLKDINGNLVADGTSVRLVSTLGTITSANPAVTASGVATFTVKSSVAAGTATLSVTTVPGMTGSISFGTITTGEIASFEINATDTSLFVAGVGKDDNTSITIRVTDSDGMPIDESFWGNDNTVRLKLISYPGGGETLFGSSGQCSDFSGTTEATCTTGTWSIENVFMNSTTRTLDIRTSGGMAVVSLQAGTLPGIIEIEATAIDSGTLTTTSVKAALPQVSISSGPPHTLVILPSALPRTAGALTTRTGTVVVTDRFGNSVPDGTVLNLGLLDTAISYGSSGTTSGSNFIDLATTRPFNTSFVLGVYNINRYIQTSDRVLILNTVNSDKSRFISSVDSGTQLTVNKPYNVPTVGSLDYLIGAALTGGSVTGTSVTTNGQAPFTVTYPKNFTMANGGAGYGCVAIPPETTAATEKVAIVVSSSDEATSSIAVGDFCFSGGFPYTLTAVPTNIDYGTISPTAVDITLTLKNASGDPVPGVTIEEKQMIIEADEPFIVLAGSCVTDADGTCTSTVDVTFGAAGPDNMYPKATITYGAARATVEVQVVQGL